jgi:hypothetical protein
MKCFDISFKIKYVGLIGIIYFSYIGKIKARIKFLKSYGHVYANFHEEFLLKKSIFDPLDDIFPG